TLSVRAARLCSRRRAMCRGFPAATLTSLPIQASNRQGSSPWNSTDAIVWLILCSAGALARGFWLVCDTAVHPASYSNLLVSLSSREKRERVLRASASRGICFSSAEAAPDAHLSTPGRTSTACFQDQVAAGTSITPKYHSLFRGLNDFVALRIPHPTVRPPDAVRAQRISGADREPLRATRLQSRGVLVTIGRVANIHPCAGAWGCRAQRQQHPDKFLVVAAIPEHHCIVANFQQMLLQFFEGGLPRESFVCFGPEELLLLFTERSQCLPPPQK